MTFDEWWSRNGQFCRSGGGDYEKTFAYHAWQEASKVMRERCAAIVQANADACHEGSFMRDALMSNAEAIRALSDE